MTREQCRKLLKEEGGGRWVGELEGGRLTKVELTWYDGPYRVVVVTDTHYTPEPVIIDYWRVE